MTEAVMPAGIDCESWLPALGRQAILGVMGAPDV